MSEFRSQMVVSPLPDGVQWALQAPLVYQSDIADVITVPTGFCTDFASIPKVLWTILSPWDRYGPAAVIHDYLYWIGNGTRKRNMADAVLREAMLLLGVNEATVNQIHGAVSMFGAAAWQRNADLRASGYTRTSGKTAIAPYAGIPDLPGVTP